MTRIANMNFLNVAASVRVNSTSAGTVKRNNRSEEGMKGVGKETGTINRTNCFVVVLFLADSGSDIHGVTVERTL